MKGRLKFFLETHTPLVCFSVFVFLSFVALLLFQSRALKEMRERNERILSHYTQILSVSSEQNRADSVDFSQLSKEFKLTLAQRIAFQDYTNKVVNTAVERSHVDLEVNSIIEAKASAMYQETKDLLEMQFAKIQHESESLEVWCGILTVVFLIFSFYSLFKTDELVHQGREGVKELAQLKDTGEKKIDEIKKMGAEKILKFEQDSAGALLRVGQRAVFEKQRIEESLKKAKEEVGLRIEEANKLLDNKYESLSSAIEERIKMAFSMEEGKENESLRQIVRKVENLSLRIDELERQIKNTNG